MPSGHALGATVKGTQVSRNDVEVRLGSVWPLAPLQGLQCRPAGLSELEADHGGQNTQSVLHASLLAVQQLVTYTAVFDSNQTCNLSAFFHSALEVLLSDHRVITAIVESTSGLQQQHGIAWFLLVSENLWGRELLLMHSLHSVACAMQLNQRSATASAGARAQALSIGIAVRAFHHRIFLLWAGRALQRASPLLRGPRAPAASGDKGECAPAPRWA